MDVEKSIFEIIPFLLKKYDEHKNGATIDIGVGTFNFYCRVFSDEGFTTFAVEPLPSENLKMLVAENGIHLVTACISNFNGKAKIYTGQWQGNQLSDLSSMHKTWWGVTEQSNVMEVDSIKLETFFSEYDIQNITYLKIDTEGSEWEIISQFMELDSKYLPEIVEFEYGGGATNREQKAGWSPEYFSKTINCISILKQCGYKYVLVFDSEEKGPILYTLKFLKDLKKLFKESYIYGDVILFKEKKFNLRKLNLKFREKDSTFAVIKRSVTRIKNKLFLW